MDDVKAQITTYNELLPTERCLSTTEAERRAGKFLEAMAMIADLKHKFSNQHIKSRTLQTAVFAQEMAKGTAKTVTENKLTAESSPEYVKAREEYEALENDIAYLKGCYDIFNNAHVFYRNMAKEVSFG